MFFKTGVLQNLANYAKKNHMLEPLFNKFAGLKRSETLLKRDSSICVSYEIGKIFKDYFFYGTPLVAASEIKVFNFQGFLLRSAFCLKHVALQIIYISFTSNGNLHN